MIIEVVTKEDLLEFRGQLLNDIRELITPAQNKSAGARLKNSEVK